jgi:hypothetical protein
VSAGCWVLRLAFWAVVGGGEFVGVCRLLSRLLNRPLQRSRPGKNCFPCLRLVSRTVMSSNVLQRKSCKSSDSTTSRFSACDGPLHRSVVFRNHGCPVSLSSMPDQQLRKNQTRRRSTRKHTTSDENDKGQNHARFRRWEGRDERFNQR